MSIITLQPDEAGTYRLITHDRRVTASRPIEPTSSSATPRQSHNQYLEISRFERIHSADRRKGDRRKRNIPVLFDMRSPHNRRADPPPVSTFTPDLPGQLRLRRHTG